LSFANTNNQGPHAILGKLSSDSHKLGGYLSGNMSSQGKTANAGVAQFIDSPYLHYDDNLPDIGGSSSRLMSLQQEQQIGDDYMRQLRRQAPIINDAEVNDYMQHLGFKIVENNPHAANRQFSFFVILNDTINAFAMPGGYIALYTGLITQTDNESELASVVSHEIAHVTQRHLARRLEKQKQMTIPSIAAYLAAILVASQAKNSETATGAIMGATGLSQQAMLNNSRANEAEADRIGIAALYNAGFDPYAVVTFFEKMQQSQRYYSNAFEFLRTHPLSRSRITDARLRASNYPKRQITDPPSYHLIKAKIKAYTLPVNTVEIDKQRKYYEKGKIKSDADKYGYAIFMMRAEKYDIAAPILKALQDKDKSQASYAIALAQLDIKRKTPEKSIDRIHQLLEKSPGNLALVDSLAELLIAAEKNSEARELLLKNIHMAKHAPKLYKLLSSAQEAAGYQLEAFESEGNYLLAMGDLDGAINKFEQALNKQTKDPYARQRINAQINDIKNVMHQRSLRR
jgi:predicted Zn-dependent protease